MAENRHLFERLPTTAPGDSTPTDLTAAAKSRLQKVDSQDSLDEPTPPIAGPAYLKNLPTPPPSEPPELSNRLLSAVDPLDSLDEPTLPIAGPAYSPIPSSSESPELNNRLLSDERRIELESAIKRLQNEIERIEHYLKQALPLSLKKQQRQHEALLRQAPPCKKIGSQWERSAVSVRNVSLFSPYSQEKMAKLSDKRLELAAAQQAYEDIMPRPSKRERR